MPSHRRRLRFFRVAPGVERALALSQRAAYWGESDTRGLRMRRLLAAAMTVALAAIGAAATQAQAEPVRHRTGWFPQITWGTCTDASLLARKAECGTLPVPIDYKDPDGPKTTLAVSRIKHTVADDKYQGVILVNPGGPGAKGQNLAVIGALVPKN